MNKDKLNELKRNLKQYSTECVETSDIINLIDIFLDVDSTDTVDELPIDNKRIHTMAGQATAICILLQELKKDLMGAQYSKSSEKCLKQITITWEEANTLLRLISHLEVA